MPDYGDPNVSLQSWYGSALAVEPGRLHFAAHSHHLWPDCTRSAQIQAWDDACLADEKWDRAFAQNSQAKEHIARLLDGYSASQICLAPNTHEFVLRLLSCFSPGKPLRVLTTDSEFHSFSRQIRRCEEEPGFHVHRVPVEPFASFSERWSAAAAGEFDFVYLSHVFYNSGHAVVSLHQAVAAVRSPQALVVIDGYHAFCALPLSLRGLDSRLFYLGGGYKYAQAGEGICFMAVPHGGQWRPVNTGWFASYGSLESKQSGAVTYDSDAMRFAGATMDPTAAYRFNAVQNAWVQRGLTVEQIHRRVAALKALFVQGIESAGLAELRSQDILRSEGQLPQGHFVVFQTPNAVELMKRLRNKRIIVDARADRLRFGFGLYHNTGTVGELLNRLKELSPVAKEACAS